MKSLSSRIRRLAPSLTVTMDARAKQMIAAGADVIALAAGEPDFPTPQEAVEAAIASYREGKTRYSPPDGIPELKEAVCRKLLRDNQIQATPGEIVVSSGAKHCIHNAILALVDDGDEVLVPTPCWVTYPEIVKLAGGVPVLIPTRAENGFRMDPQDVEAAITPRTKAILFNNPCNPTGTVFRRKDIEALAAIVVRHDIWCISDEIYEHMTYDQEHVCFASLSPEARAHTILVNGVSKSHAMTGWRIGYTLAPPAVSAAIAKLQGQTTHHPANASQYAAAAALDQCSAFVTSMRDQLRERRDFVLAELERIPGLSVARPGGAFYVFPDTSSWYGKKSDQGSVIRGSVDLCNWLLESEGLALVPGAAFGEDRCIRISYTASQDKLADAMHRLQSGLSRLS